MADAQLPLYDSGAVRIQSAFELKELFRYRFLIRNLIARDLKVRYKRSTLGFIWVMLNPLLTMGVLVVVFSNFFRFSVPHYPTYLLAGILGWTLFAQGSVAAMSSLQGNGSILNKMYVPPSAFVASAVGSALVNLAFAMLPFFALAIFNGVAPNLTWAFVLVPSVELTVFTLGVGLIVSALFVFFHDIFEIYTVLLNAFMYLTPVFYPLSILPKPIQHLEWYNPMYQFLYCFREPVLNGRIPTVDQWIPGVVWALVAFAVGWLIFTRLEGGFASHF